MNFEQRRVGSEGLSRRGLRQHCQRQCNTLPKRAFPEMPQSPKLRTLCFVEAINFLRAPKFVWFAFRAESLCYSAVATIRVPNRNHLGWILCSGVRGRCWAGVSDDRFDHPEEPVNHKPRLSQMVFVRSLGLMKGSAQSADFPKSHKKSENWVLDRSSGFLPAVPDVEGNFSHAP
jgi:hypothetical protein